MDSEAENARRQANGNAILVGLMAPHGGSLSKQEVLTDLLTDLMHANDMNDDISFGDALFMAEMNYECETGGTSSRGTAPRLEAYDDARGLIAGLGVLPGSLKSSVADLERVTNRLAGVLARWTKAEKPENSE